MECCSNGTGSIDRLSFGPGRWGAKEVQHTHRLAPDVYLGVVPVTRRGIQVEAEGKCEVVEWAVKMRRLPDDGSKTSEFEIG
jgi:aminoglycoside phosphotransferase family enzyme